MNRKQAKELREIAKLEGRKTFFTGVPCRNGHVCEKYTSTAGCVQCALDRAKERKERKTCEINQYLKQYYQENKDKHAENRKRWKSENPEKVKASNAQYRNRSKHKAAAYYAIRAADPEFIRERSKYNAEWRKLNKALCMSYVNRRRANKLQRTPAWLTEDDWWMIEQIYHLAQLRTAATSIEWHVDHIIPLRGKTVSGLHVPTNLQVVSAKVNLKKGNRYAVG